LLASPHDFDFAFFSHLLGKFEFENSGKFNEYFVFEGRETAYAIDTNDGRPAIIKRVVEITENDELRKFSVTIKPNETVVDGQDILDFSNEQICVMLHDAIQVLNVAVKYPYKHYGYVPVGRRLFYSAQ
jgi:hypothetical protein